MKFILIVTFLSLALFCTVASWSDAAQWKSRFDEASAQRDEAIKLANHKASQPSDGAIE